MFINDVVRGITVDTKRGAVLRPIATQPGEPDRFSLTAIGLYLEFEADVRTDGPAEDRVLDWMVKTIRVSHLSHGPNGHPFADGAERVRILGLIEDGLRACRGPLGWDSTPVGNISFAPNAWVGARSPTSSTLRPATE